MYSQEHLLYIKKQKRKGIFVRVCQFSIVVLFIILWQLLADMGVINKFITSCPKQVIETIISLHNEKNLYHHIWVTTYETIVSFSLGTIIGCLLATILWWNKTLSKILDPYLTILNSLPKVALGPVIIIWGGAGIKSIIIMALLISVIVTTISVSQGFSEVDFNKIKLMQSFKASKKQIFLKLILPSSYANIISALKINVSMSLVGLLPPVGENFIV